MTNITYKPGEANQIIQAFNEVVRNQDYVFSDVPLDAITKLQKTIASIETEPPEVVAEAIRQWYLDYEDVRDAVVLEIYGERGFVKNDNENTVENNYQSLQEELEKLKEKKSKLKSTLIAEKDPKDPNKKVTTIYPLTKEGKVITEITPFTISADTSSDTVARMLRKKGINSGNWYGADEGENLPSKYL